MNVSHAYCPGSITLIFRVHPHKDPLKMGSTGIGFTINKGVKAKVRRAKKTTIYFNNKKINIPTILSAIKQMTPQPLEIYLTSPLPLGYGFGLSSSSSLASCIAANTLLDLGFTKKQLIKIVYESEVLNKTGLGSITTQATGGFLIKDTPGLDPLYRSLPFVGQKIYATILSKIETPTVLKDAQIISKINKIAQKYLTRIKSEHLELNDIFEYAYSFASESGLISNNRLEKLIVHLRSEAYHTTITMLGNVILTTKKPKLNKNYQVMELKITDKISVTSE